MIPGKTYVGRLPGRTRKSFVRKRPSTVPPVLVLDQTVATPPPIYAVKAPAKMGIFSHARRDGYYVSYGPGTSRPRYVCTRQPDVIYTTAPPPAGRTATSIRQTCAACGRFRSARWEAAHPLLPGMAASSSICARCRHDYTSSEEREPRPRYRRRHHDYHSRRCTDLTDESYCSLRDRRSPRRYRSDSRDYSRHRNSSRDNVRIVIANQTGERPKRRSLRSSSTEPVRVIRRTSVVEVPERVRSRSIARSSSRAYYLEDGTAQYAEDLVRDRHESRSSSRYSYMEELAPRRRCRSSSRVQFVDDLDDPVVAPRPKRIRRRRAVYFDGAGSFETLESEERGRSRSRSAPKGTDDSKAGVQLIEESIIPQLRSLAPARKPNGSGEPIEETRSSYADSDQDNHRESSSCAGYDVSSDQDRTPRPAFRSISASQAQVHSRKPSGHKRTYSKSADSGYQDRVYASRRGPASSASERTSNEQTTPRNKKRRRYRDDSTGDEYRPMTPVSFRHVRAPSPPNHSIQSDYLSEMLESSHITPPSKNTGMPVTPRFKYAHGPPSPPESHNTSDRGSSVYRPPFYPDATAEGTEHEPAGYQYSTIKDLYGNEAASYTYEPAEDLYGNKISGNGYTPVEDRYEDDWPQSATIPEYDWMS